MLDSEVSNDEYLYRGVLAVHWDLENDRPTSATYKTSNGVSVDRDGGRQQDECTAALLHIKSKDYYGICKVLTSEVRTLDALVNYLPTEENRYHSEIHDSEGRKKLRRGKAEKISKKFTVTYKRPHAH